MSHRSPIDSIDLHLVRTLCILLDEGSVSKAALKLNQTQPAVSNALKRLRELTGDPLLVRVRSSMVLTEYAREVLHPAARALADLESVFQPRREFAPGGHIEYAIAAPDAMEPLLIPRLAGLAQESDAAVRLKFFNLDSGSECVAGLENNNLDLVISPWVEPPPHLHAAPLWDDRFVLLMRAGHPLAVPGALTLETYRRSRHVALRICLDGQLSAVDRALARAGLDRDVWVTVNVFGMVPNVLLTTDFVFVCASRFATACAAHFPLAICDLPGRVAGIRVNQLWHSRKHHSPGHRWLRERVLHVVRELTREQRAGYAPRPGDMQWSQPQFKGMRTNYAA